MAENPIETDDQLRELLEKATGNDYACCYQCGKCTAGCPAGSLMDEPPGRIMRMIQLGHIEEALKSRSLWVCMGCQTCTSRCPQNMEIAGTMDALREMAINRGVANPGKDRKRVEAFHLAFLNTVRRNGRLLEMALVSSYKMRTGTFLQDVDAGLKYMLQGKINPLSMVFGGERVRGLDQVAALFDLAERQPVDVAVQLRRPGKVEAEAAAEIRIDPEEAIGYYPGCSLGGTAKEFDISTRLMCEKLGLKLKEIDDWNCCGASSAHSTNHQLAVLLPGRNQALADHQGFKQVLTPCAACLNRQVIARDALRDSKALSDQVRTATGMDPTGQARFISVLQMLNAMDPEWIRSRVTQPLRGLKVACYYGCLLVRPNRIAAGEDTENPTGMDRIVSALGADVVDWDFKVECCGAGLTMAKPDLIESLTHKIISNAAASGVEALVVACPLCHSNLDMRQAKMRKRFGDLSPIPVYYISELAAVACGADPVEAAVGKHFVPALELLKDKAWRG